MELVPESDFFLVRKNGSSIVLIEAYQTAHKSPTTFQKYGCWESGNLTLETTKDKYERRNLSGVTIRVVTTRVVNIWECNTIHIYSIVND